MKMKIAWHQRGLLLKGTSPVVEPDKRTILNSAFRFNSKIEKNSKKNLKLLAGEVLETAEKNNRNRVKQMIYEAEHHGIEFVNALGDVKKDVKTIWDVKSVVSAKEPTIFHEKNYVELLTNNKPPVLNQKNYSRTVNVFRDNYLFEKFQNVANVFPNSNMWN